MKKIMVCVGALLLLAACASQETKTTSADDARTEELRQMARGYGTYYYKWYKYSCSQEGNDRNYFD